MTQGSDKTAIGGRIRRAVDQLFGFWARSSAHGSRSTVLQPVIAVLLICAAGAVGSGLRGETTISVLFGSAFGLVFLLFLGGFIYFARTNPDALRSERFTIEKIPTTFGSCWRRQPSG